MRRQRGLHVEAERGLRVVGEDPLRRNALVFQDLDARAICERIFADYPQAAFRFDVQAALPAHPITTQYRETDWAFVTRL
ncbi:contractile injection system protein, VgrG/Pvc8 family, partial [Xanthomonas oryzae]|uniref:contractile injection system protein, VgrG/Pvc8 family n=1 Tax=Xanthomonas oryzae TaxID=347 RepID=UPI002115E5A7